MAESSKPETKRAFAFIVTGYIPDAVKEGHETSFVLPTQSVSYAMKDFCRLTVVVVGPGETPESLIERLIQQPLQPHGTKRVELLQ